VSGSDQTNWLRRDRVSDRHAAADHNGFIEKRASSPLFVERLAVKRQRAVSARADEFERSVGSIAAAGGFSVTGSN